MNPRETLAETETETETEAETETETETEAEAEKVRGRDERSNDGFCGGRSKKETVDSEEIMEMMDLVSRSLGLAGIKKLLVDNDMKEDQLVLTDVDTKNSVLLNDCYCYPCYCYCYYYYYCFGYYCDFCRCSHSDRDIDCLLVDYVCHV